MQEVLLCKHINNIQTYVLNIQTRGNIIFLKYQNIHYGKRKEIRHL